MHSISQRSIVALIASGLLAAFVGSATCPQRATAADATLTFDVVDKLGWAADKAGQLPAKATETYHYDPAGDVLTVTVRFDRKGFAPLPPMLALATEYGFPIEFDPKPQPISKVSSIGPLWGFDNADGYSYRIKGLGRYVLERPKLGQGAAPEALTKELAVQVDKLVAAGHLMPWLVLVNVPGSAAQGRGEVFFDNPAETLWLLAEIAPVLSASSRDSLTSHLKKERESFPPEQLATVPYTDGAPREANQVPTGLLKNWQERVLKFRTQSPPGIWSLYGLARYYELTGEKPTPQVMEHATVIVNSGLEHRDWATLYWLRGHAPAFNAVHGVNQQFAGFVGYIRLARAAGDTKAEALGWGLLGRTAVLRFAMGKYTQFQHASHQFNVDYLLDNKGQRYASPIRVESDPKKYEIPSDPAWYAKARGSQWRGELVAWNWTKPIDNVRQVERLDEQGIDLREWGGVDDGGTGQKRDKGDSWYNHLAPHLLAFRDITPELGRFLADHLKPEIAAYCDRVVENQPHWHTVYCESVLNAENGFNLPCDPHGQFVTRAWVLGEKPEALVEYIDVPWLPRGDLYYMHKLAETIKAQRGVTWGKP